MGYNEKGMGHNEKGVGYNEKGMGYNNKRLSEGQSFIYFVENIGIEPMTSCMPCKRSSQLS